MVDIHCTHAYIDKTGRQGRQGIPSVLVDSNVLVEFWKKFMRLLITRYTVRMNVTFICKACFALRPKCACGLRHETSKKTYLCKCNYSMLNGCLCLTCWSIIRPESCDMFFSSLWLKHVPDVLCTTTTTPMRHSWYGLGCAYIKTWIPSGF